ncbi:MAG: tetratricopeptide repeat protein [Verrucomicrobiales bacterium]
MRDKLFSPAPHALAAVALLFVCIGAYFAFEPKSSRMLAPPDVELGSVDRAVAQAVEEALVRVRASPESAAGWGKLAMILTAHEIAPEAAEVCYRRAAELDPRDVRWRYHLGMALSAGSPERAIPELERAAAVGGDIHSEVRFDLAELLLQQGRLDEARAQLQRVLQRDATDARAHVTLARVSFQRGDLEVSLDHLDSALRDPRTRRSAHILRAQIYARKGDRKAAAVELDAASRAGPEAPWPNALSSEQSALRAGKRRHLADADELLAQGRPEQAIASLSSTLRRYPDLGWAWLLMGRALLQRNDPAAAQEPLQTAARLLPESAEVQFYLGAASYLQKQRTAAVAFFRRAAELEPTLADAHFNLGTCLEEEGDRAGAIEALRAGLRCKPDSAQTHARLGEWLAREGEHREALEHMRAAVVLNPDDATTKQRLEELQQERGR